ncbi:MAG: PH domain-containing protein, partial [Acidothermales bacterium]|nr:PH domain-containing protein [Acidothermales bacterium]
MTERTGPIEPVGQTGQTGETDEPVAAGQRLSPRSLVVDPIRHLGRFLIPFAAAFVLSGHFTIDRAAYYGFAGGVLSVGYAVLRWTMFRYTLHANRLDITSGLLARRIRSIPLDRVRGVDLTATPLHRMMGIVVVRVDAAAGGRSRKDEGVLDAVSAADGARLRRMLLAGRNAGASAAPGTATVETDTPQHAERGAVIARVRPVWFLLAPLTGAYLFAPLAVLGTVWGWVNQNGVLDQRQVEGAANFVVTDPWLVGIVGALALLVAMPLASVAMSAVLNWNFTARETASAIELERGLLTRRHVTLERRRLRGWELVEALLARPARAGRLRALVTGLGTEAHGSRAC